jgi:hypothetical protein
MILGPRGKLVWFDSVAPLQTFNLAVQSYQGRPVLTWWQGYPGEEVILNRSYQTVAVVKAVDGVTDVHDFTITPQGTAWLMATTKVPADLTNEGGPSNGEFENCLIQEVDIRTGRLLWQWSCYGHIPLDASHMPVPTDGSAWDAYHLNSLQVLPDGNLLVSSRYTWSAYEISVKTGRILWTLGGKYNQFKMGPGTRFEWQHDVRRIGNTLTVFDDGAGPTAQDENQSSAKTLSLHTQSRTVTLLHRYTHTPPLLAAGLGSMQILPNGNVFVGWGTAPDFSEYTRSGEQIFNGSFALGTNSYRALRFPWVGHPATPPDMAARASGGQATVWASWNGATDVAAWRVLGGPSPGRLRPLTTQPDDSFETRITLNSEPAYAEVQALNAHGHVLPHGTSAAQPVG